jgi:hypothetical protein
MRPTLILLRNLSEEDETWFEMDSTSGNVNIFTVADPGTVAGGTFDAASETIGEPASPCPAIKSEIGNKKFKAQFARRKTHNEQTVLFTCGIFAARGTFYGAEAISNVLVRKYLYFIPYSSTDFNQAIYQARIFSP